MKNKNLVKILLTILTLIILFFLVKINIFQENMPKAVINGQEFKLEIASNNKERAKGLGGRDNLCENCGMLFEFPASGNYSFWMKDMKFSLDIIWISGNEIAYIAKNISPSYLGTITPQVPADKVLELNGGTCDKNDIKEKDIITF